MIAHGTVSREENGSFRCSENFGGPGNLGRRGRGVAHYVDFEWMMSLRHGHFFDILGEGEVDGAGTLGLRELEGLPDHLRHSLRSRNQLSPLCDRLEHADEIDYLVGFFVDPVQAPLRTDRDEGDAVSVGVCRSQQEIDRSGAEGPYADSRLTS